MLTNSSHIYNYPGQYTMQLIVRSNGGCSDTISKNIIVKGPTGSLSYTPLQVCSPGKISYTAKANNAVNYIWDFSDGTTIFSNHDTTSHIYLTPGNYIPKVILKDGSGCSVAIAGSDTVKITGVVTNILFANRLICDSGYVSFSDSTIANDVVISYKWDFGDGTTSALASPSHLYTATGVYSVGLIVSTPTGCTDTAFIPDCIKIARSPRIKITGDSSACEPAQFTFQGTLAVPDTSSIQWSWVFANGNTAIGQAPPQQAFGTPGVYKVKLTAVSSEGCTDTAAAQAIVHANPIVDAGPDMTICKNQSYTLTASGASTYSWLPGNVLSCQNCASPVVNPQVKTTYHVVGTSASGCTNKDSVTIDVRQPFIMTVTNNDTICVGETVSLGASGADTYNWTPAVWLSNAGSASPTSRPDTSITYMVVGRDNVGCYKDSAFVKIKVYQIPTIEITNGDKLNLQIGSTVKLNTRYSPDVTNLLWSPSLGLSCVTCSDPITSTREDVTYMVTATNAGNCKASDKIAVTMICQNANVFIPNTFSPNGDGMNDAFYPRGAGLGNIRSFRIFNRWGQMVFQKLNFSANDPNLGWDGKLNGIPAQPDVYMYVMEVICANNQVLPFKGNVSLLR